ncbi:MAG: low-specificity L-threonine aldolase [Desulfuromonas sp.]|nr:MAG: low-specificity L-threonine aldolase [Desulfuromonas sp.]
MEFSDFRSDTLTMPTMSMRAAMHDAVLGDDVYGEDPTVNRLEAMVAERLGKEASIWLPSGTQANLVALLTHCQRGDEYIVGQAAHCYRYEGGGAAVCGGIQPQPLSLRDDGTFDLEEVEAAVKPDDYHFARTRLVCLENTHAGMPLAVDYLAEARLLCDRLGLALHVDGARLCNAAVARHVDVSLLAKPCDSLTLCLSKGLGAPAGSMLAGARSFIDEARRWRKMLGGGMRQVGMLAAAGIHALQHHVERLADDHQRAAYLASELALFPELHVDRQRVLTNMVFCSPGVDLMSQYQEYLLQYGIRVGGYGALRFVTHLDVGDHDVERLVAATRDFFASR